MFKMRILLRKGVENWWVRRTELAGSYLLLKANREHSLNIKDLLDNSPRKHLLDLNLSEYVNLNIRAFVIDDVFLRNWFHFIKAS